MGLNKKTFFYFKICLSDILDLIFTFPPKVKNDNCFSLSCFIPKLIFECKLYNILCVQEVVTHLISKLPYKMGTYYLDKQYI